MFSRSGSVRFIAVGCLTLLSLLSTSCSSLNKEADATPAPPDASQPGPAAPPAPYSISAIASGPLISFTIVNNDSRTLEIRPDQFALIPDGTRQVIPYEVSSATIEVAPSVGIGQSVQGRAMFREFATPAGGRLVFKPDDRGAYTVIRSAF